MDRLTDPESSHARSGDRDQSRLMDAGDEQRILVDWNATNVRDRVDCAVQELFQKQVELRPEAVAVVLEDRSITYADLDARSNQLARYLVERGVGPDVCVAMCTARSLDMVVVLLAILKAGGAYVPLEPSYPPDRLGFMVRDANAPFVITDRASMALLEGLPTVLIEDIAGAVAALDAQALPVRSGPQNLAYVMYTSGSTGTPKGVEVPHRAIGRLVISPNYVDLGPDQVLLHAAPLAFDASTFEIWGALLQGGRCVLYPERVPTPGGLRRVIERYGVTTIWLTAALFNAIIDQEPSCLAGAKQVLTGGEALSVSHMRRALDALPNTRLINGYGPTETTTFATAYTIPRSLDPQARSVPIGRPIQDTHLYVLDPAQRPVAMGEVGELYIGGKGVARGYLRRPDLTSARFVVSAFEPYAGESLYRTGDLVRYLEHGVVDYQGRIDHQVKIRGYRIELGEIESTLAQHPDVRATTVIAREDTPGDKRLVAYLVRTKANQTPPATALREHLGRSLPAYMIPSAFVWLDALPITDNGKVDRRALPPPPADAHEGSQDYVAPVTPEENAIAQVFAEAIGVERVGRLDNFFHLGGNSLLVLRVAGRLRDVHGYDVPVLKFFEFPTPAELAGFITGQQRQGASLDRAIERGAWRQGREDRAAQRLDDVAIIGMSGRFPGASNLDQFWRNLCEGVESITYFGANGLDPNVPAALANDPAYVRARGVVEDADKFDPGFFGMSPREAELTDPQQRLFLEVAWEALEHAGYVPDQFDGAIGVFAGTYNASYFAQNVSTRPDLIDQVGAFQAMLLNEKDYVATRAAHKFNLTGPALSLQSACSTSLVAVAQAVQSLQLHQCDMAIAGGSSIVVPMRSGYLYQEGGMLSVDGHCRAFDAHATGTTFSDGVAILTLKRLSDAVASGDTIYAVIRGVALNNDGAKKASYTAPSVQGQASVVATAHATAGVDPRTISYIETHGTATPLGDPIEIEALTLAFRKKTQDKRFCAIGSVKSNVGHLVMAAGATGLIKTALSLYHQVLPASLFFDAPNPRIPFEDSPFYVNSRFTNWDGPRPLRAGVSSFGVGGTNAHAILEEPPTQEPSGPTRPWQLVVLSARTASALDSATERLGRHLDGNPDAPVGDVAYTLARGRKHFRNRRFAVRKTTAELAAALINVQSSKLPTHKCEGTAPDIVFQFPGQGSQYVKMGAALYQGEPAFRAVVDLCSESLLPVLGLDLRKILYPETDSPEADAAVLRSTEITQPAIFVISYAVACLLQHWGIRPSVMIGHSVGEFVCGTLASVFSLEDALRLVATRGRLMSQMPPGSMLSVRRSAKELESRLQDERLSIAAENAPNASVASGPADAIDGLKERLEKEGIGCRPLHTSHAFHSPMMDPAVVEFRKVVEQVTLSKPRLPFVSTATGKLITDAQATDPEYWATHLRRTVRFADGIATLIDKPNRVFVEAGPRTTLTTLARHQITDKRGPVCIATLGDKAEPESEWTAILTALGHLYSRGAEVAWDSFYRDEKRHRVPLPTYPFELQRCWVDPAVDASRAASGAGASRETPGQDLRTQPPSPALVEALAKVEAIPDAAHVQARIPKEAASVAFSPPQPSGPVVQVADPGRVFQIDPSCAVFSALPQGESVSNVSSNAVSSPNTSATARVDHLIQTLKDILEEASGTEVAEGDHGTSFLDLGLDSLFLTQVALTVQKRFGVKLSFRQLIEEHRSVQELAEYMDKELPPEAHQPAATNAAAPAATPAAAPAPVQGPVAASAPLPPAPLASPVGISTAMAPAMPVPTAMQPTPMAAWPAQLPVVLPPPMPFVQSAAPQGFVQSIIDQQLRLMAQQMALLSGTPAAWGGPTVASSLQGQLVSVPQAVAPAPAQAIAAPAAPAAAVPVPAAAPAPAAPARAPAAAKPATADAASASDAEPPPKKPFGAMTKINLSHSDELTAAQRARLDAFIRRHNAKTKESKRLTQLNRPRLADPRVVSGFRPVLKDIVYPLVVNRSSGSKFWDVDGNEYIDLQCGFGSNFFGWSPPFVIEALKAQLDRGIEIGPQHPMAGEVAALFCEVTGNERAAFCNTGSEAVMGALRISRTVSGRRMVASFAGAYHGIFDEVIVRGTKKLRSLPAAPGIMPQTAENILVVDYGTPESLEILRSRANDLAAVLVEPVQSRRPDLQPREFLHELRKITEASGTALIFDEVVTGFRIHPGGAQAHFGIRADIATYGKVVGGGISIGVISGKRKYLDALDGGFWQYGDDSAPTVGVTYFAGTFVRHPLALAAAKAVLTYIKEQGPELQARVSRKVELFATEMNAYFQSVGAPLKIDYFGSVFKPVYTTDLPFGELLFAFMRDRGINIRDGFPCFFTTAHSDEDIARIKTVFKEAIAEMHASEFMPKPRSTVAADPDPNAPPVPGAKLGRDPEGRPAWYAPNPAEPGKYVKVKVGA